jgi:hypothetical protein
MKCWLATIEQGKPKMAEYTVAMFHDWCKENEGRQVRIEPVKKAVSVDMRNYYFGAVLPVVRSTCDEWKNLNSLQIHEIVKKMLFYFEAYNPKTERVERFGRSVMSDSEWNNTYKATQFLDVVGDYLVQCGLEMPNSEEYKKWRDSAPMLKNDPTSHNSKTT